MEEDGEEDRIWEDGSPSYLVEWSDDEVVGEGMRVEEEEGQCCAFSCEVAAEVPLHTKKLLVTSTTHLHYYKFSK